WCSCSPRTPSRRSPSAAGRPSAIRSCWPAAARGVSRRGCCGARSSAGWRRCRSRSGSAPSAGLARSGRVWRPQQIVALVLALLLVVSGFTNAAAPQVVRLDLGAARSAAPSPAIATAVTAGAPAPTPPDASIVVDAASAVGKLADPASTSRFDVDRTAAEVGNDPAALFAFVHDTISTQVYPGVLRGARGTLVAGAGNSWDQAMLLAD